MNIYRHGDILFRPVTGIVKAKTSEKKATHIVAYGEATGHHHLLTAADGGAINAMTGFDQKTYVAILGGVATLTHQEHNMLSLEEGCYEIITEREYDYFENDMRKVVD